MSEQEGAPENSRGVLGVDHLGDPLTEQRQFFSGNAVVDCDGWHVLSLAGPDRLTWLDALSSQLVLGLGGADTTENLILTPQGRVEHRWLMIDDGDTSWLLVEPGRAAGLVAWLERMKFRADVTITDHTGALRVHAGWSSEALARIELGNKASVWRDPWPQVKPGGFSYSGESHPGGGYELWFVAVPAGDQTFAGLPRAGSWAVDAAEIRAGRPSAGSEVDEKTLPHEVDWLRTAVHLNKGCYRGQEAVAKVHNLGHPPRRLVLLHLDGSEGALPEPGAEVLVGEKVVGYVTRAVIHYEWGPIALALIKRSVAGDEVLAVTADGLTVAANQELLVATDAGRVNPPGLSRK